MLELPCVLNMAPGLSFDDGAKLFTDIYVSNKDSLSLKDLSDYSKLLGHTQKFFDGTGYDESKLQELISLGDNGYCGVASKRVRYSDKENFSDSPCLLCEYGVNYANIRYEEEIILLKAIYGGLLSARSLDSLKPEKLFVSRCRMSLGNAAGKWPIVKLNLQIYQAMFVAEMAGQITNDSFISTFNSIYAKNFMEYSELCECADSDIVLAYNTAIETFLKRNMDISKNQADEVLRILQKPYSDALSEFRELHPLSCLAKKQHGAKSNTVTGSKASAHAKERKRNFTNNGQRNLLDAMSSALSTPLTSDNVRGIDLDNNSTHPSTITASVNSKENKSSIQKQHLHESECINSNTVSVSGEKDCSCESAKDLAKDTEMNLKKLVDTTDVSATVPNTHITNAMESTSFVMPELSELEESQPEESELSLHNTNIEPAIVEPDDKPDHKTEAIHTLKPSDTADDNKNQRNSSADKNICESANTDMDMLDIPNISNNRDNLEVESDSTRGLENASARVDAPAQDNTSVFGRLFTLTEECNACVKTLNELNAPMFEISMKQSSFICVELVFQDGVCGLLFYAPPAKYYYVSSMNFWGNVSSVLKQKKPLITMNLPALYRYLSQNKIHIYRLPFSICSAYESMLPDTSSTDYTFREIMKACCNCLDYQETGILSCLKQYNNIYANMLKLVKNKPDLANRLNQFINLECLMSYSYEDTLINMGKPLFLHPTVGEYIVHSDSLHESSIAEFKTVISVSLCSTKVDATVTSSVIWSCLIHLLKTGVLDLCQVTICSVLDNGFTVSYIANNRVRLKDVLWNCIKSILNKQKIHGLNIKITTHE